jgi:lipoprotein-releasing system permease protein
MKTIAAHNEVAAVSPFALTEMMVSHGKSLSGVLVKGIVPSQSGNVLDIEIRMQEGKLADLDSMLPPNDGGKALPAIFIGRELQKKLKVKLGDRVRLIMPKANLDPAAWTDTSASPSAREFRVAGVFYCGFDDFDRHLTYLTMKETQRFTGGGDDAYGIEIKLKEPAIAKTFADRLQEELGVSPYRAVSWEELNHNLFEALRLQKVVLVIFLTLIILVAAFNIVAALSMMVIDKGREIAILKSMGMRAGGTSRLFQFVGITIGGVGTALGLIVGLTLCLIISSFGYKLDATVYLIDRLPVKVSLFEVGLNIAITIVICTLATILPSRRASALHPVEGLRAE